MSYNSNLPPKIVRVNQTEGSTPDDWELQDADGTTIATYNRVGMSIDVWWPDLADHVRSNTSGARAALNDVTLLLASRDWEVDP